MKMPKMSDVFNSVKSVAAKNSPEILLVLGIGGIITSNVLFSKQTVKAVRIVDEKKKDEQVDTLPPKEIVKATWKCYILPLIVEGTSIMCLIFSNSEHRKRHAALAVAYSISESSLTAYKNQMVEAVGEKKAKEIQEATAVQKLDNNASALTKVYVTGKGDTLCYDAIEHRFFRSNIQLIQQAENKVNYEMIHSMYASLNKFYEYIGLDPIDNGYKIGWWMDDGYLEITPRFTVITNEDLGIYDEPCAILDYSRDPKYNYDRLG